MPVVRMPSGELVNVPDNPTPKELAQLRLLAGPIEPNPVPEGTTARFLAGLDTAAGDIQTAVKQRMGNVSDAEVEVRRAENKPLRDTTSGEAGYFTGKTLAPGLVAAALHAPTGLLGAIGTQAAVGGAMGALTPTGIGENAGANIAMGAAGGALGGAVGHGLSRLVTPNPNPDYVPAYKAVRDAAGRFTGKKVEVPPDFGPTLLERAQNLPHRYGGRFLGEALNPLVSPLAAAGLSGGSTYLSTGDPGKAMGAAATGAGVSLATRGILGNPAVNNYYNMGLFGPRVDLAPYIDPLVGNIFNSRAIANAQDNQPQQR